MPKQHIANFLKQLRKTSNLSANEVVKTLHEYDIDISAKTLYGYESGISMPNADIFVYLCRIYKCDNPMDIFGTTTITPNEIEIIEKYRSLDDSGKTRINYELDYEVQRVNQIQELESNQPDSPDDPYADIPATYEELRKLYPELSPVEELKDKKVTDA